MNHHRHPGTVNHPRRRDHMVHMPMNTTVRHQPQQMCGSTAGAQLCNELQKSWVFGKLSGLDSQINLAQVHRDHPARADICMPHFGIAHLPAWQTNVRSVCDQGRMRTALHETVHIGRVCQMRCIALRVGVQTPSVKDAQHNWLVDAHLLSPVPGLAGLLLCLRARVNL